MPLIDLPEGAQLDKPPAAGGYADLPPGAQLDAPQMTGIKRAAALPAAGFVQGLIQSLAPFAGAAADPSGMGVGVSLESPRPGVPSMAEIGPQLTGAASELGESVGNRPDLRPEGLIEQGISSAARGIGRGLPYAAIGPAAVIPGTLGASAAGSIGGDIAEHYFPDHPDLAQIAGNVGGFSAMPGIAALAKTAGRPLMEAFSRSASSAAEASQASIRLAAAMQRDVDSGAVNIRDFQNARLRGLQPWELENAENARAFAGAITRSGGPARTEMRAYVRAEDSAAPGRLEGALTNAFGNGDINQAIDGLQTAQRSEAGPLYREAFQANKNVASPMLDRILQTPAGSKALAGARQDMQNQMLLMGVPDKELMEQAREAGQYVPGGKGVASGMKLQTWDLIKQSMDDQINQAKRLGDAGEMRRLVQLKSGLVGELDRLDTTAAAGPNSMKPEGGAYARARATWGGKAQSLEAIENGAQAMNKTPGQIASDLADLSAGDQELYRLSGIQQSMLPRLSGGTLGTNEAQRLLGNTTDRLKPQLEALFPDQASRDSVLRAAQRANLKFQARNAISGGSPTAERAMDLAGAGHAGSSIVGKLGGAATALIAHEPVLGANYLARLAADLVRRQSSVSPELNARMAQGLTGADPAIMARALASLQSGNARLPFLKRAGLFTGQNVPLPLLSGAESNNQLLGSP